MTARQRILIDQARSERREKIVPAHLTERTERDLYAEDEWRSSAEERDAWYHVDWRTGEDW